MSCEDGHYQEQLPEKSETEAAMPRGLVEPANKAERLTKVSTGKNKY